MEVEGVKAGAEVSALLVFPGKGGPIIAEVAGEGRHVVGSVGEAEHVVSDYLTGCLDAECTTIRLICYDRKLLHYVPVKGCSLNFLTSNEVQSKRIQICREKGYFECAKRKVIYAFAIVYQEWNLVTDIPLSELWKR